MPPTSILISGAQVADGTGKPLQLLDVRIQGDTIAEVGKLKPREGEKVIAGKGLVLAPGFIDPHNHSTGGLAKDPAAETQVSQGITTLVLGPDGVLAVADRGVSRGAPGRAGRGQRHDDGRPRDGAQPRDGGEGLQARGHTRGSREDGRARRAQGMREGALGVSSGLEYDVGSYGSTDELVALCKAAAQLRRLLHDAHPRRGRQGLRGLRRGDRDLRALRRAAADLPHQARDGRRLEQGRGRPWRCSTRRARKGDDVTADCYPYEAWHSRSLHAGAQQAVLRPRRASSGA